MRPARNYVTWLMFFYRSNKEIKSDTDAKTSCCALYPLTQRQDFGLDHVDQNDQRIAIKTILKKVPKMYRHSSQFHKYLILSQGWPSSACSYCLRDCCCVLSCPSKEESNLF